ASCWPSRDGGDGGRRSCSRACSRTRGCSTVTISSSGSWPKTSTRRSSHTRTPDEFELVPNACVRLGRARRHLGRLADASAAYEMAVDAAIAAADAYNGLLGRIGAASVVRLRGDLPAAEALLDGIVNDARAMSNQHPAYFETLARALHERAYVAYEREQFECALTYLHEAMRAYTDDRQRD